jgi:hypothetical protein
MKKVTAGWIVVVAALALPGALAAHHSLVRFGTDGPPLWIKGAVAHFDFANPHVRIYLDQKDASGKTQRWAVEGPPLNNLSRMRIGPEFLKAGDVVEVCGFVLKDDFASQPALRQTDANPNALSGRVLSGHLLVMPNGKRQFWSDYGVLYKCLNPGEDVETLRREAFGR